MTLDNLCELNEKDCFYVADISVSVGSPFGLLRLIQEEIT